MYWGRLLKIDTALYPISTQHNLAVTSENISMLLNPIYYGRVGLLGTLSLGGGALSLGAR
jgi:hypothetical protein